MSIWSLKQRAISFLSKPLLIWIILSFSVLARLIPYLYNRSLWADEAVLALNIVNRSYGELFQPLDYEQGAPPFFLVIEKLAIQIFGNNEYALRFFPLLSGIASLWLFYLLAKRYLCVTTVPISLAFFASQPRLIYYSSEVKQYSSDLAIALLLCLLLAPFKERQLSTKDLTIIAILGAILIWFSHPAIFVIVGMGLSSVWFYREKKRINSIFKTISIYFLFLTSFLGLYLVSLNHLNSNTILMGSWKNEFPSSPIDLAWLIVTFDRFFEKPLGFTRFTDELAMIVFGVGYFAFWKRDRRGLLVLLSPLLVTFLAAFLHKYPFSDRLVLFLVPFFILLIAEGINYFIFTSEYKITNFLGFVLCFSLLIPHLVDSGWQIIQPQGKEEIKTVMSYVKNHQQSGDILYVYQRGKYQFQYYAEKYGYRQGDYIIGVDDLDNSDAAESQLSEQEWQRYKNDFDKLRGRDRVWFLFSHAHVESENTAIKSYLDTIGKQVDFFEAKGAFVYLYDLD